MLTNEHVCKIVQLLALFKTYESHNWAIGTCNQMLLNA